MFYLYPNFFHQLCQHIIHWFFLYICLNHIHFCLFLYFLAQICGMYHKWHPDSVSLCCPDQRVWAIRQLEPPAWSVCPASWTVCPRWTPADQLPWGTRPPSPPAAPTRSPARRTVPRPGPSTTSCEAKPQPDGLYRHRRRALLNSRDSAACEELWQTTPALYCTWDCKYVI